MGCRSIQFLSVRLEDICIGVDRLSWLLKEKLKNQLTTEKGARIFAPGSRNGFALVYPNTYYVGMSNLGMHIIYKCINDRKDTACERVFLPDKKTEQEYLRTNTPLMTLETQRPLYEFPLIGFSVTFEMDYFNLIKVLDLGKVPVLAAARTDTDPLVIIGGPCATFNPEPLADFVDLCIIGEGEEVIQDLLDTYYAQRHKPRKELLTALAQIEGIYVPGFSTFHYDSSGKIAFRETTPGIPPTTRRRWIKNLEQFEAQTVIVTADTEFGSMFLVEVARGCGRHCRFCMAGYCFRNPRIRSLARIKQAIGQAKQLELKVGLMGAAISDHPNIDDICEEIVQQGLNMSVASLRADSLTPRLVKALAVSNHKTVTLAPEAASIRMRDVINKGITDEHMYEAIRLAIDAGIHNIRLYIMIDLPFERDEDIEEIILMARKFKEYMKKLGSAGKLTLSVNPFIPKPFTPFQWLAVSSVATIDAKLKHIQTSLKKDKNIEVLAETAKESNIQGILARGDRRLGSALLTAYRLGGYKYFKRAMREHNLQEEFYLYRTRDEEEIFPWSHLNMGFHTEYLWQELQRADSGKTTPPCSDHCTRCGVCK